MGGGNPLKQIKDLAMDIVSKPSEYTLRAIGADGVADTLEGFYEGSKKLSSGAIDMASGKAKRQKDEAKAAAGLAASEAQAAEEEKKRQAQAAETSRIEGQRMAAGAGARTLLTGPAGLDDEESITRRTLAGM